jgi:RNA recognition motif-containing protein
VLSEKAETDADNKSDNINAESKEIEDGGQTEEQSKLDEIVQNPVVEEKKEEKDSDKGDQEQESAINLTLEKEENINEENVEQDVDNSEKNKPELDEKTTPNEQVQVEEPKEPTATSATPQQASKKSQDVETGTSPSNGTSEESTQQKKPQSNPRLLWITNVPKNTRANELKQLLSTCGKVVCAKVVVNARFPGSCCFGYVTMGSAEDATNVITKLNNTEFNGQIIKIDKFENIKADNLNPARKKTTEESKKVEKKEDKIKKSPEGKEKVDEVITGEDKEKTSVDSPERRKSLTSDRSSRGRRRTPSRERMRERERPFNRSSSGGGHRGNVLTFDKIKVRTSQSTRQENLFN